MDIQSPHSSAFLQRRGYTPRHTLALALLAIAWGMAAPAVAQNVVSPGETLDVSGADNLGELRMEGGTLVIRDGERVPSPLLARPSPVAC